MNNNESKKEKIRRRYQGINPDRIEIIPAIPEENIFEGNKEKRVAVYARVSTGDPRQTSSYELQKNHYLDVINRHPNWKLVNIYADEGISGTSLKHRDEFISMIKDCEDHKIDLIITKSVSRFARNVVDCIGYTRKLAALNPPVGVLFETEDIYTFRSDSEMRLALMASVAQEESHNKSEVMNASIEMRFRRGIFLTPPLLGYDQDEDGKLTINEKEASIVRLIFFMYLYGYTCNQIAETLTKLGCKTKKGNMVWAPGSVLQILQNERHCGAVLARKTWTPNYLDHKSKKNRQNRNQYRHENNHEAIISRDDFIAVQRFIDNAKYGNKRFLPELKVINQGALSGFVTIHPRWAGFRAADYFMASDSVSDNTNSENSHDKVELADGEFDLRGYEIARSQFFNTAGKIFMTISKKNVAFSNGCVNKFGNMQYVEILINPKKKLLAVRPSDKNKNNSVRWSKIKEGNPIARTVSGVAFLSTIYEILGWNLTWKYRVQGTYYNRENSPVIIFDMNDTEVLIHESNAEGKCVKSHGINSLASSGNSIIGYPTEWIHDFGYSFYTHAQTKELEGFAKSGIWDADNEGNSYVTTDMPRFLDKDEISRNIHNAINEIKKEKNNE